MVSRTCRSFSHVDNLKSHYSLRAVQAGGQEGGLTPDEIAHLVSLGVTGSCQRGVTIIGVDDVHEGPSSSSSLRGPAPLGNIVYSNAAFEAMCGRSSEQLLGSSFDLLIGPDTDPEQVSRLRESLSSQQPDTLRLLCYHSSGRTFWDSVSVAPISSAAALRQLAQSRGAGGTAAQDPPGQQQMGPPLPLPLSLRSSFFICIHDDVSSMVSEQAGFRLRDQALHSCSEGITIVDPSLADFPIVYANEAFLQMTG